MRNARKRIKRYYVKHVRLNWWSLKNWRQGLRFDPVGRCRFCDHTTPYHYPTCRTRVSS